MERKETTSPTAENPSKRSDRRVRESLSTQDSGEDLIPILGYGIICMRERGKHPLIGQPVEIGLQEDAYSNQIVSAPF
jgi:hypothetical protein